MPACGVCISPRKVEIEKFGQRALLGEISWREACRQGGANNPKSLQNHMLTHFSTELAKPEFVDRTSAIKDEAISMYLRMAEAATDPDEKTRLYLKVRELQLASPKPDAILRVMKEERELESQKGMAHMLAIFGRKMFEIEPERPLVIDVEVIDGKG